MSGFGAAPIKKEGSFIEYDRQYVLRPQVIGYKLSQSDCKEGMYVLTQVLLWGDGKFEQTASRMKVENLGNALREALAVLMVLPKEGGYIAGIGARCGDEFYIERGRVE